MALPRICIIGTGALGSLFAARLSAVADIWVLGNWTEQLVAMRNGLRLRHADGTESIHTLQTSRQAQAIGPCDGVLVLVKSYQTAAAAQNLPYLLGPQTSVLTLQNGLGNREQLQAKANQHPCLAGITTQAASLIQPGLVADTGPGPITLGSIGLPDSPMAFWSGLFRQAGFEVKNVADVEGLIWGKLVVNSAINALTAILDVPNGALLDAPSAYPIMAQLATETAQIAHALGLVLPFSDPVAEAIRVAKASANNWSSMVTDIRRKNGTEADAIYGAIVEAGKQVGIPTPFNERALALVKLLEAGENFSTQPTSIDSLFAPQLPPQ